MSEKDFVRSYLKDFSSLLSPSEELVEKLVQTKEILIKAKKNNSKIMIFGNGGSAAIASHTSIDFTKAAKIRSINFNDSLCIKVGA